MDGLEEDRVGGQRPLGIDPLRPGRFDRGNDLLDVLRAEQPVFAGVGVEPAHRDARRRQEPTRRLVGQADHVEHPVGPGPVDRVA